MNVQTWKHKGVDSLAQSLTKIARPVAMLLVWAALSVGQLFAQDFSIDWLTSDGGGGTSTNGTYSLTGTIGQVDASGSMTNAQYSVTGGIWFLPSVVQQPDAPVLTIVPAAPGFALISWTPNTPGFVLQESLTLEPPAWTNSPSGATNPVTVPATLITKVYRLQK